LTKLDQTAAAGRALLGLCEFRTKEYDPSFAHLKRAHSGGLACLRMPIFPEEIPPADREVVFLAGETLWDSATERPQVTENDLATLLAKYPNFPNVHHANDMVRYR
jgi:hypothetical protein